MATKMTQEETLTAIELVCKELLNAETVNRWYSVKERPLTKIMEQVGLNYHFSSAIYEELANIGMIEKEGEKFHMRYKIVTNVIPDAAVTAKRIYERYTTKLRETTSRKDLTPYKPRKAVSMDEFSNKSGKKVRVYTDYSRISHLGQIVYTLIKGQITEARITCVRFDDNNKVKVDFSTPMLDEEGNAVKRQDYCLRSVAFSVEELINKLQTNIVKFDKKK